MLAISKIVYIEKDIQNKYNIVKFKIELEYLKNLYCKFKTLLKNLEINSKKQKKQMNKYKVI